VTIQRGHGGIQNGCHIEAIMQVNMGIGGNHVEGMKCQIIPPEAILQGRPPDISTRVIEPDH